MYRLIEPDLDQLLDYEVEKIDIDEIAEKAQKTSFNSVDVFYDIEGIFPNLLVVSSEIDYEITYLDQRLIKKILSSEIENFHFPIVKSRKRPFQILNSEFEDVTELYLNVRERFSREIEFDFSDEMRIFFVRAKDVSQYKEVIVDEEENPIIELRSEFKRIVLEDDRIRIRERFFPDLIVEYSLDSESRIYYDSEFSEICIGMLESITISSFFGLETLLISISNARFVKTGLETDSYLEIPSVSLISPLSKKDIEENLERVVRKFVYEQQREIKKRISRYQSLR